MAISMAGCKSCCRYGFHQIRQYSGAAGLLDQGRIAIRRQQKHGSKPFLADGFGGLQATHARHHRVEDEQVGTQAAGQLADNFAVVGFSHYGMPQTFQHDAEVKTQHCVVVRYYYLSLMHLAFFSRVEKRLATLLMAQIIAGYGRKVKRTRII